MPLFHCRLRWKFTVNENGINRGAKATVLWAPFMQPNEIFVDILDWWHTRQAVPFAVRAGCMTQQHATMQSWRR